MVTKSPSKLWSQLSFSSFGISREAKALRRSEDSRPPKLSWGLNCGRYKALGDIAEAKSSSQLSSPRKVSILEQIKF